MIPYLILIVTSILVGLVAVLLYRRLDARDRRAFLSGALVNAGTVVGILLYRKRRRP